MLESILLVFDEPVEAGPQPSRAASATQGEVDVNPGTGIVTLTFTVDVEAGSGFFHIWQRLDTITMRGNVSEFDVAFIKEAGSHGVPVEAGVQHRVSSIVVMAWAGNANWKRFLSAPKGDCGTVMNGG
eukprot:Skav216602  [mRNA]  locus=scaffold2855:371555:383394:+ [translate_table: standard]